MRSLPTAVVLTVLGVSAATGGEAPAAPEWFQALDRDRNGAITLDEMHGARYLRFARADTDRDGLLTPRELRADRPWLQRFATFDENKDGRISIGEFELQGRARFVTLDENGDGRLSLREALVAKKAQRAGARRSG